MSFLVDKAFGVLVEVVNDSATTGAIIFSEVEAKLRAAVGDTVAEQLLPVLARNPGALFDLFDAIAKRVEAQANLRAEIARALDG